MSKQLSGVVSSDMGSKTIVVRIATRRTHPIYRKQYTINRHFKAHDEKNEAKVGDRVLITETRPLSASKHFELTKILDRAGARFEETDAIADIPEEEKQEEVTEDKAKAKKADK